MSDLTEVVLSTRQWHDILRVLRSNIRWKNLREEETVTNSIDLIERFLAGERREKKNGTSMGVARFNL